MYELEYFDIPAKNRRLAIHHWRREGKPRLVWLSGFLDSGYTAALLGKYIFKEFDVTALDWPGHGDSDWLRDGYYNSITCLNDLLAWSATWPKEGVHIIGHSLGAGMAARFCGMSPREIHSLVCLEGFAGLSPLGKERERLERWARKMSRTPGKVRAPRQFAGRGEVEMSLRSLHAGAWPEEAGAGESSEKMDTLVRALARPVGEEGGDDQPWRWHYDPRVKEEFFSAPFSPIITRELWSGVKCPVLWLTGKDSNLLPGRNPAGDRDSNHSKGGETGPLVPDPAAGTAYWDGLAHLETVAAREEIQQYFGKMIWKEIAGAGHNLHYDQPEAVCRQLEEFYREC